MWQRVVKTVNLHYSLFPDAEQLPETLETDADRADYVARVCGAWDFDIVPTLETFLLLREWRDVFDRFPISGSPSYAAFRSIYGWPAIDGGRVQIARYERLDARARDATDPFAERT